MTLVVAAVVIGVAIPSFTTQILNNRSVAAGEDFVAALNFAKSEAIHRAGVRVSLCASSDGATCGSTDWRDGFIAVVDYAAAEVTPAPALTDASHAASTILRVWKKLNNQSVVTVTQGGSASFIRFNHEGTLARVTNNPVIINAHLSNCTNNAKRTITVGIGGVISVAKVACP